MPRLASASGVFFAFFFLLFFFVVVFFFFLAPSQSTSEDLARVDGPESGAKSGAGTGGRARSSSSSSEQEPSRWASLHLRRQASDDLELGGELAGLPAGATRYIARRDLAALAAPSFPVTEDANFALPVAISGVPLAQLSKSFAASPAADLVVAICSDQYQANYSPQYLARHHPVLVLRVNGQDAAGWPKSPDGLAMGPYLISHPSFPPSPAADSEADEPQIPWGVLRLEFRQASIVFGAIAPAGRQSFRREVQVGYRIAQQNCLRCHFLGAVGGKKSGRSWQVLAAWASSSPAYFSAYVRRPQSARQAAQMPANPKYDDAQLAALTAYFQTFSPAAQGKP